MADSKLQLIHTVISDAVKQILTANGYETDLGAKVDDWRTDWQEDEMPATSICDLTAETVENQTDEYLDWFTLPVQIRTFLSSATRAAEARKMLADILKALEPFKDGFGGAGHTVLAKSVQLKRSGFALAEDGFRIAGIAVEIEILYYTKKFNAYE